MSDRKALGRGLAALIPNRIAEEAAMDEGQLSLQARDGQVGAEKWLYKGKEVAYIPLDEIKPNRFQPRKNFNNEALLELADSIKQKGVLQPILVRQLVEGGFEILAGERRWRAAKNAGLDNIPAIVKATQDVDALEISLIENIQRDDLNPIEEARAYKRLMEEFGLSYEHIGQMVGKAVTSVINIVRLLGLSDKVQEALAGGLISSGHAKVILSLKNPSEQEKLCEQIIKRGFSVREVERISNRASQPSGEEKIVTKDVEIIALEEEFQRSLGTKVRIFAKKRGGRLVIEYFSNKDLERIADLLRKRV